jgi:hypothetical protein
MAMRFTSYGLFFLALAAGCDDASDSPAPATATTTTAGPGGAGGTGGSGGDGGGGAAGGPAALEVLHAFDPAAFELPEGPR